MVSVCQIEVRMGTYTTNYQLYMPTVGETGWGTLVNTNFSTIDTTIKSLSNRIAAVENEVNGNLSCTSVTTSGKITGNGGIAGTTGTFSGAITAASGTFGNIGRFPPWTLVFSTDSTYFAKYGVAGSAGVISTNTYLNINLAQYYAGLFPSSGAQITYTYVNNYDSYIGARPINNIIVKSGSIEFGLTCTTGSTTCTIDGKTAGYNSYTSISQNNAINYLTKVYTVTFTYTASSGYADKPSLKLGIKNIGTSVLYYMFIPNILPI